MLGSLYPLGLVALLHLVSGLGLHQENAPSAKRSRPVFLERSSRSQWVSEPVTLDGNFLRYIADAPGDVLVLLYSPTCPDCEWLTEKVWKTVAEKLSSVPGTIAMTVSDPGFAAPKPFEHWHNPAIFWASKDRKMEPIFFPQARLQEYLAGIASRPQDQQDTDFVEDLLVFAKGAAGVSLFSQPAMPAQTQPMRDVESVADRGWTVLQGKWAAARNAAAASQGRLVVQPALAGSQLFQPALAPPAQAVQPALPPAQPMQSFALPNPSWMDPAQGVQPGEAPPAPSWMYSALPHMERYQSLYPPTASLISSAQSVQSGDGSAQQPNQWAMSYAQQFVRTHAGEGYTVAGVYDYALPYYQRQGQGR